MTQSRTKQPASALAIAFACAVSFMGIGLVDPILPAIANQLDASPSQTMLLFTSYLFITAITMFFTSWVSGRIGVKKTLVIGLVAIVIFAALSGAVNSVDTIIALRGGWGLGNALFISTALAAIVGAATGGSSKAIILYESAMGVGLAIGPLVGGLLGAITWRAPFFGTAVLMAIASIAIIIFLKPGVANPPRVEVFASFKALKNPTLRALGSAAFFYNFAFFVLLAYSPFPLEAAAHAAGFTFGALQLGLVFFGWGLALAISSVLVAPRIGHRVGHLPAILWSVAALALVMLILAILSTNVVVLIVVIVLSGAALGVVNTLLTEVVMGSTTLPKNIASSTYSGIRFFGGAIAPAVAGPLAGWLGVAAPYVMGAIAFVIAGVIFWFSRSRIPLPMLDDHESDPASLDEAQAISVGDSN